MKNSVVSKFRAPAEAPKPPKGLGRHGKTLWVSLQESYGIDDAGGLSSLLSACRSEDDIQRMRQQVKKEGDTLTDRFGQKCPHPLLQQIRGSETVKRQALAGLHLDIEPLRDKPGRPGGR